MPCQSEAQKLRQTRSFGFAGGLATTIEDLSRWIQFNLEHTELISKDSFYSLG